MKIRINGIGVNPKFNVADISVREENKPHVVAYDYGLSTWDKPHRKLTGTGVMCVNHGQATHWSWQPRLVRG